MSRMLDNLARVQNEEAAPARPAPNLSLVRGTPGRAPKRSSALYAILGLGLLGVGAVAFVLEGGMKSIFEKPETTLTVQNLSDSARGLAALKGGQFAEAAQLFQQAIRSNPKSAANYLNLGFAKKRLGLKKEAEQAYQQALKIEPHNAYALNNLGALYLQGERLAEAEPLLRQSLEIFPGYADARLNLAALYEQSAKWPEASAAYDAYLALPSSDAALLSTVRERARKVRSLATAARSKEKF